MATKIKAQVVNKRTQAPLAGARVVLFDGENEIAAFKSSDGAFEHELDIRYAEHLVNVQVSKEGFVSQTLPCRLTGESVVLAFALEPVVQLPPAPLPELSQETLRRARRLWLTSLVCPVILAVFGLFLHHDLGELIALINPFLIALLSLVLIARVPLYRWSAALAACVTHIACLVFVLPLFSRSNSDSGMVYAEMVLIMMLLNAVALAGVDALRGKLGRLPVVGRLIKPQGIHAQWRVG